ncbi:MAG: sensor histidine kinase [Alphaproteobacteria bacterium]
MLGLSVLTGLVAITAGFVIHESERSFLGSMIFGEKRTKFDLLISSTMDHVISEDVPQLETVLKEFIEKESSLKSIEVLSEDGATMFKWRRERTRAREPRPNDLLSFDGNIELEGEPFGTISATWDISQASIIVGRHTLAIVLAVGGVCIVMSALGYLLMNAFAIVPINRISEQVLDFREGVLDNTVHLPSFASSELRHLKESVDALGEFLVRKESHEAELKAAKDLAEAASRAKSEFLASMSHELRTPLNAILGFAEMIEAQVYGPVGDARYGEYVHHIGQSGSHLLALINDILDISKVEAGRLDLEVENVDLAGVIADCTALVRDQANEKRLAVTMEIGENLPFVPADPRRLTQVLLNLLSNAIKFTDDGGAVTVSARHHSGLGAIVKVSDTGIGIPAEMIERVLQPFEQVESTLSRRYDGAGLGLPLARALVALHGGELGIRSELNVGTEVMFTLPVRAPRQSRGADSEAEMLLAS